MEILITKHARQRFGERVAKTSHKLTTKVIRAMLAASVDYEGPEAKTCANKKCWLHKSTGVLFVVNFSKANRVQVITVMKLKAAQETE